jgi:Domain of unknown function (DUF4124)
MRRIAMVRATPWLVSLVVLVGAGSASAKTYRWVNDQGVVTYSDQPRQVQPVPGDREALITEALDISGTKKALEAIPGHIRTQFEARQMTLKPDDKARVVRILGDAFRPDALYGALRAAFRTNYEPQHMGVVIMHLRSPLFQKIAGLELAAAEPGAKQEIERFALGLQGDIPKPERVGLVQRHEAAMRSAELQVEMAVVAFQTVVRSLEPIMPSERRPTTRENEFGVRALRAQQDSLTRTALVRWLYTYRSLSDGELASYVEFGESDAGRWFASTQRQGLLDAMRMAMATAARQMAAAFPPKR